VRLVFLLLLIFGGAGFVLYLILWFFLEHRFSTPSLELQARGI
jgi:phage shock protein PspC (stress-responsive transcriptional regulator)